MYLYRERDVIKHCGPERFLAQRNVRYSLRKLYERHLESKRPNKRPFEQPEYYRVTDTPYVGAIAPGPRVPPPPFEQDDDVDRSVKLLRINEQLPLWLWKECNDVLRRIDLYDGAIGGQFLKGREREDALARVPGPFADEYPPRPVRPLLSSGPVDAVRAVLKDAPKCPPQGPDYNNGELHSDGTADRHSCVICRLGVGEA
ncbi:hypothetical protein BN946_scf184970.g103 [Trametes cinnabarina]|uniref:Uncharacterized protein n=1 Tax=Pycnoporus cinnabarinus TaxID=5643 RepID=A0A060SDF6_PYCCI|nr:hypothetical protein BN946_scf184970.g103 [Trametes cinnabarina]